MGAIWMVFVGIWEGLGTALGWFGGIVRIRIVGIWGFSGLGVLAIGVGRLDGYVKWYRRAYGIGKGERVIRWRFVLGGLMAWMYRIDRMVPIGISWIPAFAGMTGNYTA